MRLALPPTHRTGADIQQDPIRLRNALATAERELVVLGWRTADAEDLLDPARQLIGDRHFWRHQTDGLAPFIGSGVLRTFRVPITFEELAVVSTQFHLRPPLPLIGAEVFWLSALRSHGLRPPRTMRIRPLSVDLPAYSPFSQNAVRLFRGSRHAIAAVDTGHPPTSKAEALAHKDPEKQLQAAAGPIDRTDEHSPVPRARRR